MAVPKISVIMPVFNGGEYLREAIDSILQQTFVSFELLVVNDCSTDNTAEILDSYNDKRLKILTNKINKGVSYSRNKALKEAQGGYIALMDADDIAVPERLQIQYDFMEKNKDIGVCGGCVELFGAGKGTWRPETRHEDIKAKFLFENDIYNPTAFIRHKTISECGLQYNINYHYAEDYEFFTKLLLAGIKFANIDKVLTKYRRHRQSASIKHRLESYNREKIQILFFSKLHIKDNKKKILTHNLLKKGKRLTKADLGKVSKWIEELLEANKKGKVFEEESLKKRLALKWFGVCYHSTNNGFWVFKKYKENPLSDFYICKLEKKFKFFIKCLIKV